VAEPGPAYRLICSFRVPARPIPWKVPVVVRGRKKAIKDKSLKGWQEFVAFFAALAMRGKKPHEGPVALGLDFDLVRLPTSNPDTTNLLKSTEDALQNICFLNDSQVVRVLMARHDREPEGVDVAVWAMEE
jgi:Holliday junction resolvase RusA-like endonuclease